MKGKVFLIVGILLLSGFLVAEGTTWMIFAERGEWEPGVAKKPYGLSPSGSFEIKNIGGDDNITSGAELFASGEVVVDAGGGVETFRGTTELGARLMINGKEYFNLPAGAKFEYMFGDTSIKPGEDVLDFIYEGNTISGGGEINIDENGFISSKEPYSTYNDKTGKMTFTPPSDGETTVVFGPDGNPSYIGGEGTKVNLEKYGVDVEILDPQGASVHWDECSTGDSDLCIYDSKIVSRSGDGGTMSTLEISGEGENAFYKRDKDSDLMRFSGEEGKSAEVILEKDIATVRGNVKVTNGNSEITSDPHGNLYSSKVYGSENTAMPVDIYSSEENGVRAKHYVKMTEDGDSDVKEVGLTEQGKYVVKRLRDRGTYEMSGGEDFGDVVSDRISFDGNFESGEIVEDYKICDSDGCIQLSNAEIDCGTMKRSTLYHKCGTLGVDCDPEGDPTQTVKDLYSASQKSGGTLSVTALTNKGTIYNF
ncbi:hypothetical protein K8R30_01010 [archaeon]|nr:hypothetical protein [archaeon]